MSNWNSWAITTDERVKHDAQFQFLKPTNGYLTGEQAREFFLKSGLPPLVLGQIWSLSDLDADGKLDKKEFSIAMYLIKKKIEGMQLPSTLPAGLRDDPQLVLTSSSSLVTKSPSPASGTVNVNGVSKSPPSAPIDRSAANSPDFRNWTSSALSRPKYRLLFNQHDRAKRGYLTGVESRGIFLQSGLSQQILAHIWSLADLDKDGNLDCEEFCIASFLIERALAGAQLPQTLPPDLLPNMSRASGQTSSLNNPPANVQSDDENKAPPLSFEDKRRENFRQGQVELDRRKQELAEKLRQEEDARLEKERQERKRFEQICMEKERQKAIEAERHTERLRELEVQREARRRQAMEARTQAWRAAEAQRQKEAERQRVEALKREKSQAQTLLEQTIAHRASLLESASSQEQRRRELDVQLMTASARVDAHKSAINEMRGRRDTYERDIRDLTEQVEAAKAELTRWQREREQLSLRISTGVDTNQTTELCKTLTMNRELRENKINQLKSQLRELDENMTRKGQELASRRNTVAELDRRSSKLQLELLDLRKTLEKKYLAHKGIENPSHKESSPADTLEADREQYEVMFDFTARHPDELSLTVGTVVDVYVNPPVKVAAEWLYGEVNGNKGLFPESYVRKRVTGKIDPFDPFGVHKANANASGPSPSKDPAPAAVSQPGSGEPSGTGTPSRANFADPLFSCIALYPFESTVVGDLNLAVNDVVHVYTVRDEWWEGVCVRTKQSGLFPANYMRKLTPEEARSAMGHSAEPKSTDTTNQVAWPNPLPTEPLANVVASSEREVASSSPVDQQPPSISNPTTSVTSATKPEFARVIAPYAATAPGQLSLQLGQVVQLRKRSNKGWWEGELQQRGRVRQYGWFPADYVKLITPSTANGSINDAATVKPVSSSGNAIATTQSNISTVSSSSTKTVPTVTPASPTHTTSVDSAEVSHTKPPCSNGPVVERMQAIFSYKAAHADELTFEEGAIITVIGRDEPEWWRGRLHSTGAEGLFPMNYVRPYNPAIHDGNVNPTKSSESSQQSKKSSTPGGSNSPRPAELVDRLILADSHLDLKHRTRDLIIKELISTEEAYAVDLLEVQTVFLEPLSKSGLLTSHQINRIFSNWVALYQFSLEFHRALAGYLDDSSNRDLTDSQFNLGKVLLQQIPKFGIFRQYCTNQDAASQFLQRYLVANEPLQLLVQDCERKTRTKGLPLSSYLLKPLQRLTKYRLFLDRILENTDPSESCFGAIQEAHTQLVAALGQIDGAVGSRLANRRIAWLRNHLISGDRAALSWLFGPCERSAGNREQLLYYGTLHKAKSNRELVVFLFTHFLLLTTPGYSTGGQSFEFSFDTTEANNTLKMYKQPISLAEIVVSVGTSLRSLEVSKLYNSLSVLPAVRSRSVSAVENQNGFRAIPSCSSLSNFSVTGFADDIPVQSTMHTIQPTFSLFLRSNPEHPLIVLKASNTKERDRWVTHIWKAIRNPVKCFPPSSLIESPSRLPFDPERKAGQLLVSVVRSWTSNKNPVSICLEFAMDDQPTQTCTLLSDSPSQSMAPLCFMYSNSEHSCLSVSARNSLESSMPRTAGHFRLQISCLLKLVDTTTSDPGIIKRVRLLNSPIGLHVELNFRFRPV